MVNINELRIGNWILLDGIHTCVAIDTLVVMYHNDIKAIGIPLIEDVLVKSGLKFRHTEPELPDYWEDKKIMLWADYNGNIHYDNLWVKWLHQLQNLYFALTGTELEINL